MNSQPNSTKILSNKTQTQQQIQDENVISDADFEFDFAMCHNQYSYCCC